MIFEISEAYQWRVLVLDGDVRQVNGDALLGGQVVLSSLARLTHALGGRAIARQVHTRLGLKLTANEQRSDEEIQSILENVLNDDGIEILSSQEGVSSSTLHFKHSTT